MTTPRQHKLIWTSSYDRGLQYLLYMWPDIKKSFPDATMDICYGWDLFLKVASNNPERMNWKSSIDTLIEQEGITHHGRIGQEELKKLRQQCGIWSYPTDFTEINCISALQAQQDGVVPVVMNLKHELEGKEVYTALDETVGSGIKVEGDIKNKEDQEKYLQELLSLMGDKNRWKRESLKAEKFAKDYYWNNIADKWIGVFEEKTKLPKVSIITPTIRTGFWNIMAQNISNQTYKNLEWIIVDDYKEDRSETAKKYEKKYNIEVHYIRGSKSSGSSQYPRKCGLVRANNLGWQNAKGELLVWLQDFVLMPKNGIERLVWLHQRHPKALLSPVDVYYHAKKANKENVEDWWDGETDVLTEKGWTNPRVQNLGIRTTDNPFDYEANYGAIPRELLVKLNGWWEFFDDGLGFDNTECAYRALKMGYKIILDDTNVCKCINIWPEVKGTAENILNRERKLNPPRYMWFVTKMEAGELPLVRDEELDKNIKLDFNVPDEVKEEDCSKWIDEHKVEIVEGWIKNEK